MGVATGDVGVVKSPRMLHDFLYVKITILYVISTHKNSVIITEKNHYNMHMAVFAV